MSFMRVASRQVWIAGITTSPDRYWMAQMARNASLADVGFLNACRYLVHDRDAKFCAAFDAILKAIDIQAIKLPPHSPNLNAHLERWHRSVKEEIACEGATSQFTPISRLGTVVRMLLISPV